MINVGLVISKQFLMDHCHSLGNCTYSIHCSACTLHALMHAYNAHFGASCIHNNELPQFGINCYFCRHTLIFFIALQCDKIKGFHDFISIQSRASPQTPIGELTALNHTTWLERKGLWPLSHHPLMHPPI